MLEISGFDSHTFHLINHFKAIFMKYQVAIWEYERGWGSKIDEIKDFDTKEEADTFIIKFNSKNTEHSAPDWYMVARAHNYS
jgi:hypothetical protein